MSLEVLCAKMSKKAILKQLCLSSVLSLLSKAADLAPKKAEQRKEKRSGKIKIKTNKSKQNAQYFELFLTLVFVIKYLNKSTRLIIFKTCKMCDPDPASSSSSDDDYEIDFLGKALQKSKGKN